MTKVLVRQRCCVPARASLQLLYGEENLLDDLHRARPVGGFSPAALVGPGRDHPHPFLFMVGRLPQRVVLSPAASGLGHCETAARIVASPSATAGKRPTADDRGAGKRGPALRSGHCSSQGKSVAARRNRVRKGASHSVGAGVDGQNHGPAQCSSRNGETSPLGEELKARNAERPIAVHCELSDEAEPGRRTGSPEHLRLPDTASRCLNCGRAAVATVEQERGQQQNCNFFHELSLSLESDPRVSDKRFLMQDYRDAGGPVNGCKRDDDSHGRLETLARHPSQRGNRNHGLCSGLGGRPTPGPCGLCTA